MATFAVAVIGLAAAHWLLPVDAQGSGACGAWLWMQELIVDGPAEAGFLGVTTDPNDPDTCNMGWVYATYGGEEIRCRKVEPDHGLAASEADDRAWPGSNSYPRCQGN